MKICVCGGRDYNDYDRVKQVLDNIHKAKPITNVMNGGAQGADKLSSYWAACNAVPYQEIKANWNQHGKAAGPIRNKEMVDEGFDLLVAFPGGKGTENMIQQTNKAKLRVLVVPK